MSYSKDDDCKKYKATRLFVIRGHGYNVLRVHDKAGFCHTFMRIYSFQQNANISLRVTFVVKLRLVQDC